MPKRFPDTQYAAAVQETGREVAMRQRVYPRWVYPRWVSSGKLTQEQAEEREANNTQPELLMPDPPLDPPEW